MAANDEAPAVTAHAEAELLQRAATGDHDAFAALAALVTRPAFGLAVRVLGDSGRAEDAVQEALLKLWQNASRFDVARGSFAGWWRRILMNTLLDARRRLRPVTALEETAEIVDAKPGPLAQATTKDIARHVQKAMAHLPDRQRAALALFHAQGLSMKDIAAALDTTPKAVEGLLLRGREALRQHLGFLQDELT